RGRPVGACDRPHRAKRLGPRVVWRELAGLRHGLLGDSYATLRAMVGAVLVLAGLVLFVAATSRGYVAARSALLPLVGEGDPTRTLIDATRPLRERPRVRVAARSVAISIGWIVVAGYGLFLATVGARVLA